MPARKSKKNSKKHNPKDQEKNNENIVDLTEIFSKFEEPSVEEYRMHFIDIRRASFDNWPFDEETLCNPQTLAEAGFYHIPTSESPDATRCFCCYKELDGWEPDDDPWDEHKKRSPGCIFLSMKKDVMELTTDEFIKLECEREKNKVRKLFHSKQQEFEAQVDLVRAEMFKLNPSA